MSLSETQSTSNVIASEDISEVVDVYKDHILRITDFRGRFGNEKKPYLLSQLAIPALGSDSYEVWKSPRNNTVTYGQEGEVEVVKSNDLTILRIVVNEVDESDFKPTGERASTIAKAGYDAYITLFSYLEKHNPGTLLRIWNYVPNVLGMCSPSISETDRERYRQFNIGRRNAWDEMGPRGEDGGLVRPAATLVGSKSGPLVIECVISTHSIYYVDNPRQVAPYNYPKKFGTRAPDFSRGALHITPSVDQFFVSGTASIVGAETVHLDDPVAQVQETFHNIETLIGRDNLAGVGHHGFTLNDLDGLRVYIKNPTDYEAIRDEVEKFIKPNTARVYLNSDMCRQDLLFEIEGIATKRRRP